MRKQSYKEIKADFQVSSQKSLSRREAEQSGYYRKTIFLSALAAIMLLLAYLSYFHWHQGESFSSSYSGQTSQTIQNIPPSNQGTKNKKDTIQKSSKKISVLINSKASIPYQTLITRKSRKYQIQPALLASLIEQESRFKNYVSSPYGAAGLTQLIPETAAYLGVKDVYDPSQSIEGGAKFLNILFDEFKEEELVLAAYNAGQGAVYKFNGIPPYTETQHYVQKVLERKAHFQKFFN